MIGGHHVSLHAPRKEILHVVGHAPSLDSTREGERALLVEATQIQAEGSLGFDLGPSSQ
jgi:hypothetical protein